MKRTRARLSAGGLRELTRAEEEIMHVLWRLERAFVKDIVAQLPDPKPAYNTVSTIVRILQDKGFVGHTAYGKTHQYHPIVTKEAYSEFLMKGMVNNYFGGSLGRMVSFFVRQNDVSLQEFEALMAQVQGEITDETPAAGSTPAR
ncbi:MAG: BlaI/MecI/CopY family transcriptional regulator [Bacteroidia bacterium]|nr:BlaI/MecI/CopY family transcriptional regulator [Bacteroidia bacterium]